jgi:hypothetical protein
MPDRSDGILLALVVMLVAGISAAAIILSRGVLEWGSAIHGYMWLSAGSALVSFWLYAMRHVVRAAIARDSLRSFAKSLFRPQILAWLAVAILLAPVFLANFTMLKTLIGIRLGFSWDRYLTDLETSLLGTDAWRLTHAAIDPIGTNVLQTLYVGVWIALLSFSMAAAPLFASRDFAARFLLSMFLTWIITGLLFAALMPSAGPCFAHLFDPELGPRFQPLMDRLGSLLRPSEPIQMAQSYLTSTWNGPVIAPGGGISAFPSVHVAVAGLYVAASWRIPVLRAAAIVYALAIWIGSVHFGYHYAVDGIVGVASALSCWFICGRIVAASSRDNADSQHASQVSV